MVLILTLKAFEYGDPCLSTRSMAIFGVIFLRLVLIMKGLVQVAVFTKEKYTFSAAKVFRVKRSIQSR